MRRELCQDTPEPIFIEGVERPPQSALLVRRVEEPPRERKPAQRDAVRVVTPPPGVLHAFHELRHSFASFAAAAVAPSGERLKPEEVGDIVGQSAVYMTERYRHEFEGRTKTYGGVLDY